MDTLRHYIVLMRNSRLWIVGPFETVDALGEWGDRIQRRGHDDPRWQSIELPDSAFSFEGPGSRTGMLCAVLAPDHPDAAENGQPD